MFEHGPPGTKARPGNNRDWHGAGDVLPVSPMMEAGEIIAAHQPDKGFVLVALLKMGQSIDGVGEPGFSFHIADTHCRGGGHSAGRCKASRIIAMVAFQGISTRNDPPDLIKLEAFQARFGDM